MSLHDTRAVGEHSSHSANTQICPGRDFSTSVRRPSHLRHVCLSSVVALALSVGCHGVHSAPTPVAAPAASLVIEQPSLIVTGPSRQAQRFTYEPRFRLRETRGLSGASIENVFVGFSDGGGDNTGPSCLGPLRLEPAGTLDTFFSDFKELGYCAPLIDGTSGTPEVHVIVTFIDDAGVKGQVRAIFTASTE